MNKPLIAGLLTAWCLLVVAPALLVSVVFPDTSTGTDIGGSVVIIWIVGYLVQIGVFMIAARKATSNAIGGWFLASSMPFVADWSVPVAPWSPIAIVAVVGAYSVWLYSRIERRDNLQHNGIPATGTVLEVKKPIMNVVMNNVYIRRTLMLRVKRSDGTPPYRTRNPWPVQARRRPQQPGRCSPQLPPVCSAGQQSARPDRWPSPRILGAVAAELSSSWLWQGLTAPLTLKHWVIHSCSRTFVPRAAR